MHNTHMCSFQGSRLFITSQYDEISYQIMNHIASHHNVSNSSR